MPAFRRSLRRSLFVLLGMVPGLCAAQPGKPQFLQPEVQLTGVPVASFLTGQLQEPKTASTDFLYIGMPAVNGNSSTIVAGELLYKQGFTNLLQNQITFPNVSRVVVALADFDKDKITDYAFALSGTIPGTGPNLCVYFGSGAGIGAISYDGAGNPPANFPPAGGRSGCTTLPIGGSKLPDLAYMTALSLKPALLPQLLLEDAANNVLYVLSNNGGGGFNGILGSVNVQNTIPLPAADGAGPIYSGDFNHDGNADLVVNGQPGHSATVYLGNGDGTFQPPVRYVFDHGVHSMLLQDMDGDGNPDLVVEGDNGVIEIFRNNKDGTFGPNSIGGTAAGVDGFSGNGGHLAAIGDVNGDGILDILTATPVGLSVLQGQGGLAYQLAGIYNIGPGRTSFALADFYATNHLDLAVDSPEGIAIALGDANGDGGFQTAHAFAALRPALAATVNHFRTIGNPKGNTDVVVATPLLQAQLLTGNGDGTFHTFPAPANTGQPLLFPANLWSNLVSGDFNGDGIADIAYSVTGLPVPNPAAAAGVYVQYGKGDGSFAAPVGVTASSLGAPASNTFFGESVVGDFNGDGVSDLANTDSANDDTLLGQSGATPFSLGLNQAAPGSTPFSLVAAGFFKLNRTAKQDLIVQQGARLLPFLNSGDGQRFTAMPALAGTPSPALLVPSTLLLADLDHDGNGDVIAVYYNPAINSSSAPPAAANQVYIWFGNGDGTFAQPQTISLSRSDYLAAVADLNNDGLPDLLLADGSVVSALYNLGNRTFHADYGTGCNPCGEQHFLAGQGINSLTVADVNGDGTPDLIVANGGASISNPIALGGATQSSIALTPNLDVNTGGITVLANNIVTRPVTGTLAATPEPSQFPAAFTITATLTPSAGVALPTGFVSFYLNGTQLGSPVAVTSGTTTSSASYTVPAGNPYAAGTYALTATYSGDTVNSSINLSTSHAIVNSGTTTTLLLCVGPSVACPSNGFVAPPYVANLTMYFGQTFNGTAQAAANDGSALTGSIAFNDNYNGVSSTLCTLPVGVGSACPPSVGTTVGTGAGTHVFTAVYSGDAGHSGSTSPAVTLTVLADVTSATVIGAPNPSPQGQPVTFTATLAGNFAAPTGSVIFLDGTTTLGSATLVPNAAGLAGTATFTTSTLLAGSHPITASYAASLDFGAAVSPVFTEIITLPLTGSFQLTATPNPVTANVGFSAALTITITPRNGFAQGVNLACANLPSETKCTFVNESIAGGGGSTTLFVTTTAPHSCNATQPYFLGSQGSGLGVATLAAPAFAGMLLTFLPRTRRWLRTLFALLIAVGATQIMGCGNCTDLGTRPADYTFQVTGSSLGSTEVESQTVTLKVTI